MSAPPAAIDARPAIPTHPVRSFVWAAGWLVVAVLGFTVLARNWERVVTFDFSGQRSEGLIFGAPIVATLIAILLVIRGVRAVGRTRAYRARWSAAERERFEQDSLRGQPITPFFLLAAGVAALWLAGSIVTLVFLPQLSERAGGLMLLIMLLIVLAMAWVALLQAGLRRRAAARRAGQ